MCILSLIGILFAMMTLPMLLTCGSPPSKTPPPARRGASSPHQKSKVQSTRQEKSVVIEKAATQAPPEDLKTAEAKPTSKESKDSKEEKKDPSVKTETGKGSKDNEKPSKHEDCKDKAAKEDELRSNSLKPDNRAEWAKRILKKHCKDIAKEHKQKIKGYFTPGKTYEAHDKNIEKNRYTDVKVIDETRIVLKGRKPEEDYIHASFVRTPNNATTYICAQGPLPETINDFWQMVLQEKVKFVIMLCQLMEGGTDKCALYYPDKLGMKEKYGDITVEVAEVKKAPVENTIWNVLNLTDAKGEKQQIYHVIVPWWPDQLAPHDPKPMIQMYKWIQKTNPKGTPILVHCSAGVGRTATFVGIDYANIRMQEDPSTEVIDVVKEMRSMRYQAVQTHVQYLFLHVCLLEYFIEEGIINRTPAIDNFYAEYRKHASKLLVKRIDKDVHDQERQRIDEEKQNE